MFLAKFGDFFPGTRAVSFEHLSVMGGETQTLENARCAEQLFGEMAPGLKTNLVAKRVLDIVISGIALIMLFPFLLSVYLLIRLESPGQSDFCSGALGKGWP